MTGSLARLASDRRVLLLVLAWAATRLLILYKLGSYTFNGDVIYYASWATEILRHQQLPHTDMWQYPVGAAALLLLPELVANHYEQAFAALMVLCDLGVLLTLIGVARRQDRWWGAWSWVVLPALLGPLIYTRFDLASTLAVVLAAALLWREGETATWRFGASIGVGVLIKVWPVLGLLLARTRRELARALGWMVALGVLVTVAATPVLGNTLSFITNQSARGLEEEAVAASPWFAGEAFSQRPIRYHLGSGSPELTGMLANHVAGVLHVLMIVLGLLIAGWWWWQTAGGRRLTLTHGTDALLTAMLWYIVVSPVLSPQYLIWLAGILALTASRPDSLMRQPMVLIIAAILLTGVELDYGSALFRPLGSVTLRPAAWLAMLLVVRNLLLLASAILATRSLLRAPRQAGL
ncbi:MAG: glycosyltransferase 87 family protein [Solirubrobacteraceae bacterium]